MSNSTLKHISGAVCVTCVTGIVVLFGRIVPLGMSGEIAKAKPYIIVTIILFAIGIPAAFIYQVMRNKPKEDKELEDMRIKLNTLSQAQKDSEPNPPISNLHKPN